MSTALKIAVVEDHDDLRDVLISCIKENGHQVSGADCAEALDELMENSLFDLIVLDIGLPGENGYEIARRLKQVNPYLFIIMTTALSTAKSKVSGYESGADIYLTKPVAVDELIAAIQNISRRINVLKSSDTAYWLDIQKMQLIGTEVVDLNKEEIAILKALIEAPMQRMPYFRLLEITKKDLTHKSKSTLEVQFVRLRKKLQQAGLTKEAIKVNWGDGYQLTTQIQIK
jgi:DNA-binding response OmpR family regulator